MGRLVQPPTLALRLGGCSPGRVRESLSQQDEEAGNSITPASSKPGAVHGRRYTTRCVADCVAGSERVGVPVHTYLPARPASRAGAFLRRGGALSRSPRGSGL